jgi:hypothetical protein
MLNLKTTSFSCHIMVAYWAPTGNFNLFLYRLDDSIQSIYRADIYYLTLDNSLSWKKHIEAIVPKLSAATFAMRKVQSFLSLDSLKLIYYSYFHSVLTYRIIFWSNTHYSNAINKKKKRIIRIMVGIRNRDYCKEYFKFRKYCHYSHNICYHF